MTSYVENLAESLKLEILSELHTNGRSEKNAQLPEAFTLGEMAKLTPTILTRDDFSVWQHQALALDHLVNGRNVVVSTGTASGKSLIFQLDAIRRVAADRSARILVIYPLKALCADQHRKWKHAAQAAGFNQSDIGKIDGDVKMHERNEILESAKILIMTPDICHAWFMRNVGSSSVRRFLNGLSLMVLDEAHIYESAFGSNVAFLMRRVIAAKGKPLQIIATSATVSEPAKHLHLLTGLEFEVVDEQQNGAPHFQKQIMHVNGADYGAAGETVIKDIVQKIISLSERKQFIVFLDSRKGVERVVRSINDDSVFPYRSGYEAEDRQKIENALYNGSMHGVIATSSLELGIDIADMEIGITLGIPISRKAFHQRLGRVGRAKPGAFMLIAPPTAFARLGLTFNEYFDKPPEGSQLYLGNRFIQFAQSRCLLDEMEVLGSKQKAIPARANWPDGFSNVLASAKPGANRPREFDYIAQLGADNPHINYPLRMVGEANLDIQEGNRELSHRVGTIALSQAIREAYPGGTYLHARRAYYVYEWRTTWGERAIRVGKSTTGAETKPILANRVNFSLQPDGIIDGRVKTNETGLIAEVYVQVNESVEGYSIGKTKKMYKDLRAENPAMSRKQRDFRTTGVVLRIEEDWFRGSDLEKRNLRSQVAEGLRDLLSNEFGIAPFDIDSSSSNIGLLSSSGPRRLTDAVLIYDVVFGSLRLTEALYDSFSVYLDLLDRGASLAGDDAIVNNTISNRIREWANTLSTTGAFNLDNITVPDGWRLVYKRGSILGVYVHGTLFDREIIGPELFSFPGETSSTLFYRYRLSGEDGIGRVPHDQIQQTGQDWGWELWNPDTDEFQEVENEG